MMTAYERKALKAQRKIIELKQAENPDTAAIEKQREVSRIAYENMLAIADDIIAAGEEAQAQGGEISGPMEFVVESIGDAKVQRAIALIELDRSEEALAALDESIQQDPDNMDLHFEKGQLLFRLERWEEAAKALEPVVEAEPENEHALFRYGRALLRTEQYKKVVEALKPYLFQGGEISVENHRNGADMIYPHMYDDLYEAYTALEDEDALDAMAAVKVKVIEELGQ
jgi:predicted Zn-dependent protease